MRTKETKQYIYSAYAQSLSGVLEQPGCAFLTHAPSAALSVSGGLVSHMQENIQLSICTSEIIRASRASAKVIGEKTDKHYITLATATVEKLNILDVVTADRVVSKVTSIHPINPEKDDPEHRTDCHPAQFFVTGSHFDNLKINGKPYDWKINPEPNDCLILPKNKDEEWFKIKKGKAMRDCLLGKSFEPIHIEQFGTIRLCERFCYGEKLILTMLRVKLGCPDSGSLDVGTACTNGKDGL